MVFTVTRIENTTSTSTTQGKHIPVRAQCQEKKLLKEKRFDTFHVHTVDRNNDNVVSIVNISMTISVDFSSVQNCSVLTVQSDKRHKIAFQRTATRAAEACIP